MTCLACAPFVGHAQALEPGQNVAAASAPLPAAIERGWIGIGVDLALTESPPSPPNLIVRVVRTVK